jgi:hypothetical protein
VWQFHACHQFAHHAALKEAPAHSLKAPVQIQPRHLKTAGNIGQGCDEKIAKRMPIQIRKSR